jgi:hypothetical protein
MPALVKEVEWVAIAAHLLGWPLLVKVGLLTGFSLAAAVQHLLAA